ncbi:hypothetical protein J4462_03385 [Candidatus Pacearchaeota archaeon]|nr:hypothetical protein [Candidatus Pacearchaeota archaeon]
MEIKTVAKRWGSSIGIIIPKDVVGDRKIKENDEIVIKLEKGKPRAGIMFGRLRNWKKHGQDSKDEMRKGWESESDRKRWK